MKKQLKRKSNKTMVDKSDSEDEVNKGAGTSSGSYHLTGLRGTEYVDIKNHIDPPAKKIKLNDLQFCWWVNSNNEQTLISEKDMEEFVEEGITPNGTVSINFNNFCVALTETRESHLFNHSCLLTGYQFNGNIEYVIKISKKTCLGMREFNEATNNTKGCLPIKVLYEVGDYNVFVRSKPTDRLDDIITFRQQTINPRKCASDLAAILDNMHNENIFVRFIVPQNIVFIENNIGQQEVMFEEFNTIKFIEKKNDLDSGKDSEVVTTSGDEYEKGVENLSTKYSTQIKLNLNTLKSYDIEDEIESLGHVISNLSHIDNEYMDLNTFGKSVQSNTYSMKQIATHPALQSLEKFNDYVCALSEWITQNEAKKKKFNSMFKKIGNNLRLTTFCEKVFTFYNDHHDKKRLPAWKPDLAFPQTRTAASFVTTLAHIIKNGKTVYENKKWKKKGGRDTFLKTLRMESTDLIEKMHRVLLKMEKNEEIDCKEDLCIPEN